MSQTYTVISPPDAALKPPPGVIPDFQDPFTLRPYFIVTASLGLVITGFLLILRMYTKIVVVRKCRWEDCMLEGYDMVRPMHKSLPIPRYVLPRLCKLAKMMPFQDRISISNHTAFLRRVACYDFRECKRKSRGPSMESYKPTIVEATQSGAFFSRSRQVR